MRNRNKANSRGQWSRGKILKTQRLGINPLRSSAYNNFQEIMNGIWGASLRLSTC